MGDDPDGDGTGQPVAGGHVPVPGQAGRVPQTSDELDGPSLGLQWQWQSNPDPSWWSFVGGALRLPAVPATAAGDTLWAAGHLLLQKLPAPTLVATTLVHAGSLGEGDEAGLVVIGGDYAGLGVSRRGGAVRLALRDCMKAEAGGTEAETASRGAARARSSCASRWRKVRCAALAPGPARPRSRRSEIPSSPARRCGSARRWGSSRERRRARTRGSAAFD